MQAAVSSSRCFIAFTPQDILPLLDGRIRAVLRRQFSGKVGDTFYAGESGLLCRVTRIEHLPISRAAVIHHSRLGFTSPQDVLADWQRHHPHIGHRHDLPTFYVEFEPVYQGGDPCQK